MLDRLKYVLTKLRLMWILFKEIKLDSESILALAGGDWKDKELRLIVMELLLGDVRCQLQR